MFRFDSFTIIPAAGLTADATNYADVNFWRQDGSGNRIGIVPLIRSTWLLNGAAEPTLVHGSGHELTRVSPGLFSLEVTGVGNLANEMMTTQVRAFGNAFAAIGSAPVGRSMVLGTSSEDFFSRENTSFRFPSSAGGAGVPEFVIYRQRSGSRTFSTSVETAYDSAPSWGGGDAGTFILREYNSVGTLVRTFDPMTITGWTQFYGPTWTLDAVSSGFQLPETNTLTLEVSITGGTPNTPGGVISFGAGSTFEDLSGTQIYVETIIKNSSV